MLHYSIEGTGKTLVFLHGFMENSNIWNPFVPLFSKTHQIVTIDLPGHGKSDTENEINTIEIMAEKVIEILEFLNISNATFIGHSMGGYVSLAIADVYPQFVDKVVLVNSTSLPDSKEKKEQRLKVIPTIHKNYSLFVRLSIPMLFAEDLKPLLEDEMNELKQIALDNPINGIEAALRGMRERPDRTHVFYELDKPFLIINGTKDSTIDIDLFETVIPIKENIKIEKLNCGHVAFMEKKEKFVRILTSFI
ncbi:alpha/beta fold hydrolase [Faecalibacter macacae]|uniref:Alpha/beta fold hydrolase n=1 Tax=Faecalibacter macacae TaxID=1859289 RepID=A0A3L9M7R5_9FLAO|nr:alpha/beta fold hydrolase [Faecalibacter macacae]RLZ09277.1 alpha/beta fold hydrolase [Faecalibacter macacae]